MYKIIFVDDEQNILQYLPIAIDWNSLNIHEMRTASNGKDALKIVEEFRPDIAIVDVEMPGMDGLEFCRKAICLLPDLKMVILSAFDRFDYAKRAIASGVKDYILKPVDEEELETVMKKLLSEITQTKHKSDSAEKMTLKALEKETRELIDSFIRNEKSIVEMEKDFPFLHKYENVSIVIQNKEDHSFPARQLVVEKMGGIAFPFNEGGWVALWEKDITSSMSTQVKAFDRVAREENEHFRFFYTRKQEGEDVAQSLERCFGAVEYAFYCQDYHIDSGNQLPDFPTNKLQIPDLNDALNILSEEGEISGLETIIQQEVRKAFEQQIAPTTICQMVFDIFITLKIYLTKCWQDDALKIFRKMSVWNLLRCGSQKNLHKLIGENLDELRTFIIKQKESHGNYYIVRVAKNYTKEHFQDAELSLQEVADAVGISRTYFSTTFKELTGEKYWDYLTGYRMEQAKILLQDTNMSQAEISEQVGYSSEFHFSRKFKEIVGISPNRYRRQ